MSLNEMEIYPGTVFQVETYSVNLFALPPGTNILYVNMFNLPKHILSHWFWYVNEKVLHVLQIYHYKRSKSEAPDNGKMHGIYIWLNLV